VTCHYVYSDPVTSTKVRALDAAIELLGTEGLRALTHVRVDLRAGLPQGSTSNYFRTRAALLTGVVGRILERELPLVGATFTPTSADDLVEALCGLFAYLTGPNRLQTTARLVPFIEGSHDAGLREAQLAAALQWRRRLLQLSLSLARMIHGLPAPRSPPAPKGCSYTTSRGMTMRTRGRRLISS
jgi:DNA-binding transcriptional regulator YbjK